MVTMVHERLYTVPEVAEKLRVSPYTVLNWLREGQLGGYRPGGTKAGWRIRESDVEQFVARAERPRAVQELVAIRDRFAVERRQLPADHCLICMSQGGFQDGRAREIGGQVYYPPQMTPDGGSHMHLTHNAVTADEAQDAIELLRAELQRLARTLPTHADLLSAHIQRLRNITPQGPNPSLDDISEAAREALHTRRLAEQAGRAGDLAPDLWLGALRHPLKEYDDLADTDEEQPS